VIASRVRGVTALLHDILERLRKRSGAPTELPAELAGLTRAWAQAGGDVACLVELLTHARACLWHELERVAERAVGDAEARWRVFTDAHRVMADYPRALDQLVRQLFDTECRTSLARRRTDRAQRVKRVLVGDSGTGDELGYDLSQEHVAVVASGIDAEVRVATLARRAGRTLLSVDAPDGAVWGWIGARAPLARTALRELVSWQRGQGGEMAFGEPGAGVNGFRTSHEQALEARRIAQATGDPVVRYDDVTLLALASRDPDAATEFIARELQDLATPDMSNQRLRETLQVYLEHGQSIKRTEAVLGIHRETVRRHLDAAEQRLLHPVAERSAELLVALRLLPVVRATR
jgi:hypothetical protein